MFINMNRSDGAVDDRWKLHTPPGFEEDIDIWESQFWDISKIEEYQSRCLERILNYACKNVPFYKSYAGKPFSLFPYVSKKDMRLGGFESDIPPHKHHYSLSSSGSTGEPFKYKSNQTDFNLLGVYFWHLFIIRECGVNLFKNDKVLGFSLSSNSDIYCTVPSDKVDVRFSCSDYPCNWRSLSLLKRKNMPETFEVALNEMKCDRSYNCLAGPPTTIVDFIEYAESKNINLNHCKVVTSAEQVYPQMREFFKRRGIFHRDYYHSPDGGLCAYECSFGNYHFNHIRSFVETININSEHYVCGTTFYNNVMPFIRYINYDSIAPLQKGACGCGRSGFYASSINGRQGERLVDRMGCLIPPAVLYANMSSLTGLGIWKIVQNNEGTILYTDNPLSSDAVKGKIMLRGYFDNVCIKHYSECHLKHSKRIFIIRES